MMLFLLIILFFNDVVSGKIVDNSGNPIPYAMVSSGDFNAIANQYGEFKIEVDSDLPELKFRCLGYKTLDMRVTPNNRLTIVLQEETYVLEEVVVTPSDAKLIMMNVTAQIGKIYNVFPSVSTYEYGEKIVFRNLEKQKENYLERFVLFDRQINNYNWLPNYDFLHYASNTSNDTVIALDSTLYKKNHFRNINKFFFEVSHSPYFLSQDHLKLYNFQIEDENSEIYKISFTGKSVKSEFDGVLWIDKEDFGIHYLSYWKNRKTLKAENLRLNLMGKVAGYKKVSIKKEMYEVWNERNDVGKYILKSSNCVVESFYQKNELDDFSVISNIKLNLYALPKLSKDASGFLSQNEVLELGLWKSIASKINSHTYLITFDY
ncbi:MAG: carboxypeptidase-like regulatory domain-containing protein [Mongoliitalea sp.]